jgi:hypothetical protein
MKYGAFEVQRFPCHTPYTLFPCAKCSEVFSSLGYNICIKLQVEVATKNLLGLEQKYSVLEFRNMEVLFNDLNTVKKFPERCKKARENKMISKES